MISSRLAIGSDCVRRSATLSPSRGVAQPGSALRSGRRGPQFKSGHPDEHGGNHVSPMNPLLLASAVLPLVSPPALRSPAPAAGGALSVDDQAAGCSCIDSRWRSAVTVTNEIARAATA